MLTFLGLSVLLILTPGPNQALLTSRVLSGGRRAGYAAVRGLAAGMAVHVAAATAGLSALLASSAHVFGVVKLLGGLYLLWLGIAAILRARRPVASGEAPRRRGGSPFREGLLSMTLNPKVGVYFVAVVPQFVAPGPGASLRVALLLVVYGALCLVFWSGFVIGLHHARDLVRRPRVRAWTERVTGAALIGLGARLAA
ncbi:MAG TPA: LysE family translocator [Solirubrobacteraceae bacterium]|nr:LysE family translocator [Solirubrobacteraceae bacterium]